MKRKLKNNRTFAFEGRIFDMDQNKNEKSRMIMHIKESSHDTFIKILKATNNPDIRWSFSNKFNEDEFFKLQELHSALIKLKLIIPDKDDI